MTSIDLVCIEGVNPVAGARALQHSFDTFRKARNRILVSYERPKGYDGDFIKIPKLSYQDYNEFCIWKLHEISDADYIIDLEPDGMIINPGSWTDEFLEYDYIGAPWNKETEKLVPNGNRVGNGGFSLRSRLFLELSARLHPDLYDECIRHVPKVGHHEDVFLCKFAYPYLVTNGIRFAPPELAAKFSFEEYLDGADPKTSFGFHGKGNQIYSDMIALLEIKYGNICS